MQWVAYYGDGVEDQSWLRQYNDDGSENKYADIDRSRLTSFALYDGGVPNPEHPFHYEPATRKLFHVHLEPGQRLIYRRRVEKTVGAVRDTACYLIGWQQTIAGQNVQSIAYVFEDGTVELAGRWRDDHPWFYSVQQVPEEVGLNASNAAS